MKRLLKKLLTIFILLFLVVLYMITLYKQEFILFVISDIIAGVYCFIYFGSIIKNRTKMKRLGKMIKKEIVSSIDKIPLEVYLISSIWNNKKILIGRTLIKESMNYLIEKSYIIEENETLRIYPKYHFEEMNDCTKYVLELLFLDPVSFQKPNQMKQKKLEKLERESIKIPIFDIENNIDKNLRDRDSIYTLSNIVKKEYFEEDVMETVDPFPTFGILIILFNFFMTAIFKSCPTIENFYLPLVFTFLLVFINTSKYHKNISIKKNKFNEVSQCVNYARVHKDIFF